MTKEKRSPASFELICRFKDSNPSNLNKIFDSYGCNTLEAKVPVVTDPMVARISESSPEQQMYATLAFKAESAQNALNNRRIRTRDKTLNVVQVGGETMLSLGKTRSRSPVYESELDKDLEVYMKAGARLKAAKANESEKMDIEDDSMNFQQPKVKVEPGSTIQSETIRRIRANMTKIKVEPESNDLPEVLDAELDDYMREAARIRNQKRLLTEQSDRMNTMREMEENMTNFAGMDDSGGEDDDEDDISGF